MGSLLGILITFMASKIDYAGGDKKTFSPGVPTLCPTFKCSTNGLGWTLTVSELVASFALVFTYLIVRNESKQNPDTKKWMTFVGPLVIYFVLEGCLSLSSATSNGPLNPTIALEILFWSMGAYNYKDEPVTYPNETRFEYDHYGRYSWVYICAPLLSALFAGWLARKHVIAEEDIEEEGFKPAFYQEN